MDYHTRQSLCRLGFLAVCVLPTVIVGVWIVWPTPTAQWETRLSNHIGLDVRLDEVLYPRPGVTVLREVRLNDPETGPVANAPHVEITKTRHGMFVDVLRTEVQLGQLTRFHEVLDQRILRQRTVGRTLVTFRIKNVSFAHSASPSENQDALTSLTDVDCRLARTQQGSRMTLNFHAGEDRDRPVEFVVERLSEDGVAPTTRCFLETNGSHLPCSLIVQHVPAVRGFGSACLFDGLLWAEQSDNGWNADVEGRLTRLNLDRLVSQRFPHTLRGVATIEIKRAQVRDGRLTAAAGTAHSVNGQVSSSLLAAAGQHLKLRRPLAPTLPLIHFRDLHIGFLVEESSLSLRGHCDSQGTLLTDASGQPLLVESYSPKVGIWALVRTLVPPSNVHVPLTKETTTLLSMFPLPSAANISAVQR